MHIVARPIMLNNLRRIKQFPVLFATDNVVGCLHLSWMYNILIQTTPKLLLLFTKHSLVVVKGHKYGALGENWTHYSVITDLWE